MRSKTEQKFKLPSRKARAGWEINSKRLEDACNKLGIKLPVYIRYQSGWRTIGTYRPAYNSEIGYYHRITVNQDSDVDLASSILWHELEHARQAEYFHKHIAKRTKDDLLGWYSHYREYDGPHGSSIWRNKYEVEARAVAEQFKSEVLVHMPDHYGFNHLPDRGRIEVRCIEDGCDAGGSIGLWPEEKRKEHFQTHIIPREEFRELQCSTCGNFFKEKIKRGPGSKNCPNCKPEKQLSYKVNEDGLRIDNCVICGNEFTQEIKRGRPAIKCEECRNGN